MAGTTRPPYRLPATVVPERYEIRIDLDIASARFSGEERVAITVHEPTSEILLNAFELAIDGVSVEERDVAAPRSLTGGVRLDPANQMACLDFPEPLAAGGWWLRLSFAGRLNRTDTGAYLTTARAPDGREEPVVATQFQAVDARRVFPCWDEPAFRAVFALTLVTEAHLTAISNAPVVSESPIPGTHKKAVAFANSPAMPSYLAAFVVGDYASSEPVEVGGVPIRVWAPRGHAHQTGYARAVGAFALDFFTRYYDIPYAAQKLDLIAVPSGPAMENFGAIIFGEPFLLVDERTATELDLMRTAEVIIHEVAHQWFGNLVTMRWWNGIWLNEAFARLMQKLGADAWQPAWEPWWTFFDMGRPGEQWRQSQSVRASALLTDGLRATRPVESPVGHPDEAWAMFDTLTYNKGASLLRMLEQFVGAGVFRRGVTLYLRRHAFGNTEATDLWAALEEVSGAPVRGLMETWVSQAGYPLVSAELSDGDATLSLSQTRFRYLVEGTEPGPRWQVPLTVRFGVNGAVREQQVLLSETVQRVALGSRPEWVVVNAGGDGYFRVRYAPELQLRLTRRLYDSLSSGERFNFVNDTWAETVAGRTSLGEFLDFTRLFAEEPDPGVWMGLLDAFAWLHETFGTEHQPTLAALVRERLTPLAAQLGWSPRAAESPRQRLLRARVIALLGTVGDDAALQDEARVRYARMQVERGGADGGLLPVLITVLAAVGDSARYDEFWQEFAHAATPQSTQRYLFSLAGFRREDLLARTLAHTLDGTLRSDDAAMLLRAVLLNPYGSTVAWGFLKGHWQEVLERLPYRRLPYICEGLPTLTTPEQERDVRAFFAAHPVPAAGKQLEQQLERLHIGVLFREREAATLAADQAR